MKRKCSSQVSSKNTETSHIQSSKEEANYLLDQGKEGVNYYAFIIFCVCIALALVLLYIVGLMPTPKGELVDSDCYVRLTRVTDLYESGNWYHPARMKSNTPYGDTLPWSRLFDVLLLAGAVPLSKLVGFHDALFWWGVVITPVLLTLTLIVLNWSTRALLSSDATFLVVLLFLTQPILVLYFQPARPDHHGLMIFLFVLLMGIMLRLILKPFHSFVCVAAGAISAISLWVSIESMVSVGLSLSVLGLLWVIHNGDFLKKNLYSIAALFMFCGVAMALERPLDGLKTVELDCFSIVYACLLGLIVLFWIVVSILNRRAHVLRSRTGRFLCCILGGAVIALAMWLLFPKFYKGPLADLDPQIIPIWFSKINEIQSLITDMKLLGLAVQLIASAVVSFAFLFYMFFRSDQKASRDGWVYMGIFSLVFLLLALFQLRWAVYAQMLIIIVMAEMLSRILKGRKDQGNKLIRVIRNTVVTLFFAFGFLYLGIAAEALIKPDEPVKSNHEVSLIPICDYLNKQRSGQDRPLRILTHLNYAGEILYRTDCQVLGSNYNRNASGILDSYTIMMAQTDAQALEIIRKRRLDTILICPQSKEKYYDAAPNEVSTFYQRLCQGTIPTWLKKVQLPEKLSKDFLLYRVDYTCFDDR